jgi:tetratricopeptide (TPR) repeat protein/tRNA A-37 threonylcarbamoyl transferase component Bud32
MAEVPQVLTDALADRYRLEREVGAGGMATVYLAEDLKHRRRVAVKVLRPELAASLGPQRFLREIEIAAQLSHPHVLPLLDSGQIPTEQGGPGFLYYVMPFVDGESLRERLARGGALPIGEAVRLLVEVTDALAHAHRRGVVHRDIKPDNVMLAERHALVTDFGVAKAVSEATGKHEATSVGMALGTPTYMAPEQASADPSLDHRADLYAIGAMAYEMLTGRPPFVGESAQQVLVAHLTKAPEPLSARRPGMPPALEQAVMRCLEKRPADRFQTADELLAALEPIRLSGDAFTPTSTQPVRALMPTRWYGHPVAVAAAYAAGAIVVLGVLWVVGRAIGMPAWVTPAAAVLLAIGLPIMLMTGRIERKRAVAHATGMYRVSGEAPVAGLFTWRKALLGGALAFSALALGAGTWATMRNLGIGPAGTLVGSGKLEAKDGVVVAEFDNRTSDSTLGASVSEALRIDLSQSPVITVLGAQEMAQTLGRMGRAGARVTGELAKEVATRANAKAVVTGEINAVGGGMVLLARLVSVADGTELVALRETANTPADVLPALDRLSKGLRERIGESLKGLGNTDKLEEVSTGSLEALRHYTEGARLADVGRYDEAVAPLRRAVAVDSTFAMAWRKLAVVLGNARLPESERIAAATKAYEHRERLPEVERHLTVAFYYYTVDYDAERIIAAYRAVLQLDPNNDAALNNLGIQLERAGKYDEAAELLERALAQGKAASFYSVLVNIRVKQGRPAEALSTLDRMRRDLPDAAEEPMMRATVLASMQQFDSAASMLRAVLASDPTPTVAQTSSNTLYHIDVLKGRIAESERERERFRRIAASRGNPLGLIAADLRRSQVEALVLRDTAAARRSLAAVEDNVRLDSLAPSDRPYLGLVYSNVLVGNGTRAKHYLAEYQRATPPGLQRDSVDSRWMRTWIALVDGRPRDAVTIARSIRATESCERCGLYEEGLAWEQLGQPDSARVAYERMLTAPHELPSVMFDAVTMPQVQRQLGAIYEAKGERTKAVEQYTAFLDLWRQADPELQPQVREVKERLSRLVGEGAR